MSDNEITSLYNPRDMTVMNVHIGKLSPRALHEVEINGERWPSVQMYVLSRLLCKNQRNYLLGHLTGYKLFETIMKNRGITEKTLRTERKKDEYKKYSEAMRQLNLLQDSVKFAISETAATIRELQHIINFREYVLSEECDATSVLVKLESEIGKDFNKKVLEILKDEEDQENFCEKIRTEMGKDDSKVKKYIAEKYLITRGQIGKLGKRRKKLEKLIATLQGVEGEEETLAEKLQEKNNLDKIIQEKKETNEANLALSFDKTMEKLKDLIDESKISLFGNEDKKGLYNEKAEIEKDIRDLNQINDTKDETKITLWNMFSNLPKEEKIKYRKDVYITFTEILASCDKQKTEEILNEIYAELFRDEEKQDFLLTTGTAALRFENPWNLVNKNDSLRSLGFLLGVRKGNSGQLKDKEFGLNLAGRVLMGFRNNIAIFRKKLESERIEQNRKIRLSVIYSAIKFLKHLIKSRDIQDYLNKTPEKILEENVESIQVTTTDGTSYFLPKSIIQGFASLQKAVEDPSVKRNIYKSILREGGLYKIDQAEALDDSRLDKLYDKYVNSIEIVSFNNFGYDENFVDKLWNQDMDFRRYVQLVQSNPGSLAAIIRKEDLETLYNKRINQEDEYIVLKFLELVAKRNSQDPDDIEFGKNMATLYMRRLTSKQIETIAARLVKSIEEEEEEEEEEEDDLYDCLSKSGEITKEQWETTLKELRDISERFDKIFYQGDDTRVRPKRDTVEQAKNWQPSKTQAKPQVVEKEPVIVDPEPEPDPESKLSPGDAELMALLASDEDSSSEDEEEKPVRQPAARLPRVLSGGILTINETPISPVVKYNKGFYIRKFYFPTLVHAFMYMWLGETYPTKDNFEYYLILMTPECRTKFLEVFSEPKFDFSEVTKKLKFNKSQKKTLANVQGIDNEETANAVDMTEIIKYQILQSGYSIDCFMPYEELQSKIWFEYCDQLDANIVTKAALEGYATIFGIEKDKRGELNVGRSQGINEELLKILLNTENNVIRYTDRKDLLLGYGKKGQGKNIAGKTLTKIRSLFSEVLQIENEDTKNWIIKQVKNLNQLLNLQVRDENSVYYKEKLGYAIVEAIANLKNIKPTLLGQTTVGQVEKFLNSQEEISLPKTTFYYFLKILKGFLVSEYDTVRDFLRKEQESRTGITSGDMMSESKKQEGIRRFAEFVRCIMGEMIKTRGGESPNWSVWIPNMRDKISDMPFFLWIFNQLDMINRIS